MDIVPQDQQSTHQERDHFYLALAVLAFLFAVDALWWESQQIALETDEYMATMYMPVKRERDALPTLEQTEVSTFDEELEAIEAELNMIE